jgi:hypothetical protein
MGEVYGSFDGVDSLKISSTSYASFASLKYDWKINDRFTITSKASYTNYTSKESLNSVY